MITIFKKLFNKNAQNELKFVFYSSLGFLRVLADTGLVSSAVPVLRFLPDITDVVTSLPAVSSIIPETSMRFLSI